MKNILLILLICSTAAFAQDHERIKAYKTAHITNELNLTSSEAEKFWPIYNTYEKKTRELRRTQRDEILEVLRGDMDNISDERANELLAKGLELESKKLQYHKELIQNLQGVIPPKKVLTLLKAEESFKRKLLKRMGDRPRRGN